MLNLTPAQLEEFRRYFGMTDVYGPPIEGKGSPPRIGPPAMEDPGSDTFSDIRPGAQVEGTTPPPAEPESRGFFGSLYDINRDPQKLEALKSIAAGGGRIGESMRRSGLLRMGKDPNQALKAETPSIDYRLKILRENGLLDRDRAEKLELLSGRQTWEGDQAKVQREWTSGEKEKDRQAGLTEAKIRSAGYREQPITGEVARAYSDILGIPAETIIQMPPELLRNYANNVARKDYQEGIQGRHEENFGLRSDLARRVSPEIATSLADMAASLERVNEIRAQVVANPEKYVGPVTGRWNDFIKKVGVGDPETDSVLSKIGFEIFNTLYQLSGKQINEAERADLKQVIFDAAKNQESFEAMLDTVDQRMRGIYKMRLKAYKAAGRETEGFEKILPPDESKGAAPAGGKDYREGSRTWRRIPPGSSAQISAQIQQRLPPPERSL